MAIGVKIDRYEVPRWYGLPWFVRRYVPTSINIQPCKHRMWSCLDGKWNYYNHPTIPTWQSDI